MHNLSRLGWCSPNKCFTKIWWLSYKKSFYWLNMKNDFLNDCNDFFPRQYNIWNAYFCLILLPDRQNWMHHECLLIPFGHNDFFIIFFYTYVHLTYRLSNYSLKNKIVQAIQNNCIHSSKQTCLPAKENTRNLSCSNIVFFFSQLLAPI